jgi:hypothetical protein
MIDLQLGHVMIDLNAKKEVNMYGIACVNKPEYDKRVRPSRPAPKLKRANEKATTFANVQLSRFECGLLAFDRLIRRIGKNPVAAAG